ncbi:MAG: alanine--tRNA ligase [Candidatus Babeliales bacterium]|nr:alanine--tRNA ligase [Candidatus Babeliales bacterium]
MKSIEIRNKFFDFFIKNKHEKCASSSLIPAQDPTLLFTNAGMNQFKDVLLGLEKRSYVRAVTIQKCMRAGGKHNDLDNVGFTKRHLTFFEMMGNFSFGDYFKKEAIAFAWEFITNYLKLDTKYLYVTVFEKDDEAYDIWNKEIGVSKEKIYRLGAADNFWQMGETGPCGPCSEIYYDRGISFGCGQESCAPGCSCDRFMEFWNLVFMQYNRQANGELLPLKQQSIDTGMGFERICSIMQNKNSVFEIDSFELIIHKIEELTGVKYSEQTDLLKAAFHVISDHIRACSFLIADGCSPSNEGRGYVLRKIIRRAALFEQKLTNKSIFSELSQTVIAEMGDIYPELKTNEKLIKSVLENEIEKFATNLVRGKLILEKYLQANTNKTVTGEQAFKLYDTYGFPIEVTKLISGEQGFAVDEQGFEQEMLKQREQSGKKTTQEFQEVELPENITTEFIGYKELDNQSEISAIISENKISDKLAAGSTGWVITKQSPFFVETGGQVNDKGWIELGNKKTEILDLKKINNNTAIAVKIKPEFSLSVGDKIKSIVDKSTRIDTMKNHTATHMLQASLIQVLGKTVKQSGSVVHPDYLRFDFTFHRNLTDEEIKQVEDIINAKTRENITVDVYQTNYKDALAKGVIAIFGEKYNPEKVRVVDLPGFSAELCGGTHVHATGEIGCFKIIEVGALSAGNRRILALTGPKAIELFQQDFSTVKQLSQEFKIKPDEVVDTVLKYKEQLKELQTTLAKLKKQGWQSEVNNWLSKIEEINGAPFLFLSLQDFESSDLKEISNSLINKKPGFYFIISNSGDASSFISSVSPEFTPKINLKDFSVWLKDNFGLRGGGKDVIQGGGPVQEKSLEVKIKEWIKKNK